MAQYFLQNAGVAGNNVTIADISERSLTRSKEKIEERLYKVNKRKLPDKPDDEVRAVVESLMKHFTWTTDINSAASKSDLIVENITERIELKQELFAEIDKVSSLYSGKAQNQHAKLTLM